MTDEEEADSDKPKRLLLHGQSGNSHGVGMTSYGEMGQWCVLCHGASSDHEIVLMIPPFRPMANSVICAMKATMRIHDRAWDFKNTVCSRPNLPDPTKWGSGRYHTFPKTKEGVMCDGFCTAVLTSTSTHCIRSTSTRTSNTDSIRICISIQY